MRKKSRLFIFLFVSGFFLFLDQVLKYIARMHPADAYYIVKPWLGWEYLGNTGVAFSIPFPNIILVLFTPLVVLGLFLFWRKKNIDSLTSFGVLLIIAGAVSNWIDRVLFELTIDYIRILTSVINIADIMIVAGTLFLVFGKSKRQKT